jgi:hypothetical protein
VGPAKLGDYFRLLEDQGWTWEERQTRDGSPWWKARSNPPYPACELRVCSSQGYILLEAPFMSRPLPECQAAFWRYLLRLNAALKLAKFTLGPGDEVLLAAELGTSTCTFATFRDAAVALRTYSSYFRREIEVLAAQPALAVAWMSLAPAREAPRIDIVARARET